MGKMYFHYGTVNASKTAFALMKRHEFEQKNMNVVMLKPTLDINKKIGIIRSRAGFEYKCINLYKTDIIIDRIQTIPDVIIADEIQFFTKTQLLELRNFKCDVFTFGLKTNYECKLFESIETLLAIVDTIREIPTMCTCCKSKAIISAEHKDGYKPVCYSCWKNDKLGDL